MKTDVKAVWAKIVVKSLENANFRQELLANPAKVLNDYGIAIPKGVKLSIIEQKADEVTLVIPCSKMVSFEDLDALAAAGIEDAREMMKA